MRGDGTHTNPPRRPGRASSSTQPAGKCTFTSRQMFKEPIVKTIKLSASYGLSNILIRRTQFRQYF